MKRLLLVIVALLLPLQASAVVKVLAKKVVAGPGISFVQVVSRTTDFNGTSDDVLLAPENTTDSVTVSMTTGNAIVVALTLGGTFGACPTTTVSDGTNTYTLAVQLYSVTKDQCLALYYALNVAGGSRSVTATFNPAPWQSIMALEYLGVATSSALGASPTSGEATTNSWSTGTITATGSTDALIGLVMAFTSSTANAASGGATERYDQMTTGSPQGILAIEDKFPSGSGTVTGTITNAGTADVMFMGIALKAQ